jgi:hypothetical protein
MIYESYKIKYAYQVEELDSTMNNINGNILDINETIQEDTMRHY